VEGAVQGVYHARSQVGTVTVATAEEATAVVVMGEVDVAATRDLLCEKGGKMAVAGRQKSAATAVVSPSIFLRNAGPRRRRAGQPSPGGGI
jgi:hypothetical protein